VKADTDQGLLTKVVTLTCGNEAISALVDALGGVRQPRRRRARVGRGRSRTACPLVDRGKTGSKHHLIVEAHGIPLAAITTGGNRNDVTQLLPVIQAIPRYAACAVGPGNVPGICTPTVATTTRPTVTRCALCRSLRASPGAALTTARAWAYTDGSSRARSRYCTVFVVCASAGRSATTPTMPSSPSAAPSSAGDDCAPHSVRSHKCRRAPEEMVCSMHQNALVTVRPAQPHSRDLSTSNSQPGADGSKPCSTSQRATSRLRNDHHARITSRSMSVP
jgi:hypothetical protein